MEEKYHVVLEQVYNQLKKDEDTRGIILYGSLEEKLEQTKQ